MHIINFEIYPYLRTAKFEARYAKDLLDFIHKKITSTYENISVY